MGLASTHHELDEIGGGRFQHTQHMRRVGYWDAGYLRRIASDWLAGNAELPHLVTLAPMIVGATNDGQYRLYPTRELDRYIELGQPMVKPASTWVSADFRNPVRAGNVVTFQQAQGKAELRLTMAGHFLKLDIELLGGYVPPNNQFAWPISLVGLTRDGSQLLADGVPVCSLRAPHVYDAANPLDVRPIALTFGAIGGQTGVLFTLPSLAGMARPVVDPTLALQPDAADGVDTCIREGIPSANYGALGVMYTGKIGTGAQAARGFLQFNLATLPNAAVIGATTLSLVNNYRQAAITLGVYRLLHSWTEAGCTWNRYDGTNNWTTAGAFDPVDCEQTTIGSAATGAAAFTVSLTASSKAALDAGYGWLLKATTETDNTENDISSSDLATAANRPKLTIEYTLPAANPFRRAPGWGRW